MAPPSSLPSAADVAAAAKQKYDATYGASRAALAESVEAQAEFFFQRNELVTVYFHTLINQNAFAGQPNQGHFAVADLLLVRAIQTAVTTNVDALIETAGQLLFGHVGAGIDGHGVAALPPDTAPLLKIHGCRVMDPNHMIWAPGQLAAAPISDRIASSETWLRGRMLDRDLLIIGYWTDWDYHNNVLAETLGAVRPARVIVIDPADAAAFVERAPVLYEPGERAETAFQRVNTSGSVFLTALRLEFSKSFVRQILHSGVQDFHDETGTHPPGDWTEPPDLGNDVLWQMRRDLEGCTPNEPAHERRPPNGVARRTHPFSSFEPAAPLRMGDTGCWTGVGSVSCALSTNHSIESSLRSSGRRRDQQIGADIAQERDDRSRPDDARPHDVPLFRRVGRSSALPHPRLSAVIAAGAPSKSTLDGLQALGRWGGVQQPLPRG